MSWKSNFTSAARISIKFRGGQAEVGGTATWGSGTIALLMELSQVNVQEERLYTAD